eukprot:1865517-Amphidinium_carterae.2
MEKEYEPTKRELQRAKEAATKRQEPLKPTRPAPRPQERQAEGSNTRKRIGTNSPTRPTMPARLRLRRESFAQRGQSEACD